MSVSETRQVVLDEDELRSAMANCPKVANALNLPGEPIGAISFLPAEGAVTFSSGSHAVKIAAEGLVALLVADCVRLGIPLPRNGTKSLKVLPDGVAMTIDIVTDCAKKAVKEAAPVNERFTRAMVWPTSRQVLRV